MISEGSGMLKKVRLVIAGNDYYINTDEDEDYIRSLAAKLEKDLTAMSNGNPCLSTTMAAVLNSLQMGFRTLAIQKRSGEVWKVLGAVKTEFEKFGGAVKAAQNRLEQASDELDKLVGVRTRQIQRKLANVTNLADTEAVALLEDGSDE